MNLIYVTKVATTTYDIGSLDPDLTARRIHDMTEEERNAAFSHDRESYEMVQTEVEFESNGRI